MESSTAWFSAIYFCIMVLFGSYFLMNLILGVIIEGYSSVQKKEQQKQEKLFQEEALHRKRKLEAAKMIFRMVTIYDKKREIIRSSGLSYKYSFFDLVFEMIRKERYYEYFERDYEQVIVSKKLHQGMLHML